MLEAIKKYWIFIGDYVIHPQIFVFVMSRTLSHQREFKNGFIIFYCFLFIVLNVVYGYLIAKHLLRYATLDKYDIIRKQIDYRKGAAFILLLSVSINTILFIVFYKSSTIEIGDFIGMLYYIIIIGVYVSDILFIKIINIIYVNRYKNIEDLNEIILSTRKKMYIIFLLSTLFILYSVIFMSYINLYHFYVIYSLCSLFIGGIYLIRTAFSFNIKIPDNDNEYQKIIDELNLLKKKGKLLK